MGPMSEETYQAPALSKGLQVLEFLSGQTELNDSTLAQTTFPAVQAAALSPAPCLIDASLPAPEGFDK